MRDAGQPQIVPPTIDYTMLCQSRDQASARPLDPLRPPPRQDADIGRAAALRVTWWGALVNVSLAVVKYAAGTLSGSAALVADAAHSMSDLLSDVITLAVVEMARRPADQKRPYGYGRFEAVGSFSVASVLVITGGYMGKHSVDLLQDWWLVGALENELLSSGYGGFALAACAASLVSKEALYHATARVGRQTGSQTLLANAWHHRSDALSSVAALVGVGGSLLGAPLLDPVAGLLVSGMVAKAGWEIGYEAFEELTEKSSPDDSVRSIVETAAALTPGAVAIDNLRTRKMGPYYLVDVRVLVDPQITVSSGHLVKLYLAREIYSREASISEVLVHLTPYLDRPISPLTGRLMRPHVDVERDVRAVLASMPEAVAASEVFVHYIPFKGIRLKVDIILDEDFTIRNAAYIARRAKAKLLQLPDVCDVDMDLELPDGYTH